MRTKNIQAELDVSDLIAVPSSFVRRNDLYLRSGDILISSANSWDLVGKCCKVPDLGYMATAGGFISILRAKESVLDSGFLYHWLASDKIQHKVRHLGRQTTNISNLPVDQFLELKIPLPKIEEQKRIAAILDKADAIRRKRQQAIQLADEFLRSVFLEMFGDPTVNPKGFGTMRLDEVTTKIGSGSTPRGGKSAYIEEGTTLIRSMNIHDNKFVHADLAHITDSQALALSNVIVEADDVLLNITGASVCRCAMVDNALIPARVNQHVCIIRPKKNIIHPEFLLHLIISKPFKQKLLLLAGGAGATREALTKEQISALVIPCPPLGEQLKFSLIALKIRESIARQILQSKEPLFESLSQKAFDGSL